MNICPECGDEVVRGYSFDKSGLCPHCYFIKKLTENQKDIDPEIQKAIDEHFEELI